LALILFHLINLRWRLRTWTLLTACRRAFRRSHANSIQGVRAWFPDEQEGWVCGECKTKRVDAAGNVVMTFVLDGSEKVVEFKATMKDLQANRFATLPPLKNPPQLDGLDDLTQLSNLHEPDGTFL